MEISEFNHEATPETQSATFTTEAVVSEVVQVPKRTWWRLLSRCRDED